jgi:hypothetical protein
MSHENLQPASLEEAQMAFQGLHLKLPPIPERFAGQLHRQGDWCFASRTVEPMHMYFFEKYLHEVLMGTGSDADYLALSHAGHGINSYAINYQLVAGPLALMTQASFGGLFMDAAEARRYIERQFERCAALLTTLKTASTGGLKGRPGRLLVFESELRRFYAWGWLDQPVSDEQAARTWLDAHEIPRKDIWQDLPERDLPTNAARAWLEAVA